MVRLVTAIFALAVAGCGGSPTGPDSDVPGYQGVWQGTWVKASCIGAACDIVPPSGGLRLTLAQSGSQVQGTVELATFVIPASGNVNSNGALSLAGTTSQGGATATLSNWTTTRTGNSLSGGFTLTILPDDPQIGPQTVGITLQNVTRTS